LTEEFSVELISQNGVLLKYLTIEAGFLGRWLLLFAEHMKRLLGRFPLRQDVFRIVSLHSVF